MPVNDSLQIAEAGMRVQRERMRIIAENIANAESTASKPGGEPYRRKTITFQNVLDKQLGIETVKVGKIGVDKSPFEKKYDPSHPAADAQGYVKTPNVDLLIELADMREANRTYEANLQVAKQSADMLNQTVNLLKDA